MAIVRGAGSPKTGNHPVALDPLSQIDLPGRVNAILNRWPSVGVAVGIVSNGRTTISSHGLADIDSGTPITDETVFRIASVTKVITAIAVMQLWERGLVDPDEPANRYLHKVKLISGQTPFRPATIRHLLTHTAGVPDVIRISDLAHPGWGGFLARPAAFSVMPGTPLPSLADYYRGGLQSVVEPGTTFAYSNHGFAILGQIVEDVSGEPLDHYLREYVFKPLGMLATDLLRSDSIRRRLAAGYEVGARGPKRAPDREWVTRAASSVYSTPRDMGCLVAALAGGGTNAHGSILRPETLTMMFAPHFQPDTRVAGMGLGFFRDDAEGHLIVGHDGRLPGFNAQLLVAPDDGIGVFALTNGSSQALTWMPRELGRLLRDLVGVSPGGQPPDLPEHPEVWGELFGRYRLPERVSDLRGRLLMGGGAEVFVRASQLLVRLRIPLPMFSRGFPLHPADATDPFLFRLDLSRFGMPMVRVAFSREGGPEVVAAHTDLAMLSLRKEPVAGRRWRRLAFAAMAVGGLALACRHGRIRRNDTCRSTG